MITIYLEQYPPERRRANKLRIVWRANEGRWEFDSLSIIRIHSFVNQREARNLWLILHDLNWDNGFKRLKVAKEFAE